MSPPSTAPSMLPMPPRITTARPRSSICAPMPGDDVVGEETHEDPGRAGQRPGHQERDHHDRVHVDAQKREAFGFAAMARIALPMRVRRMKKPRAAVRRTAAATMRICARLTRTPPVPPMKNGRVQRPVGKAPGVTPNTASAMLTMMSDAPMLLIIGASLSEPSRRSGRKASSSRRSGDDRTGGHGGREPSGSGRPS